MSTLRSTHRDQTPSLLEAHVGEVCERGAFDPLPGHGQPLALDGLQTPTAEQRFEALLMSDFGELLPEVVLAREIHEGRKRLTREPSAEARAQLSVSLGQKLEQLRELLTAHRPSRTAR